jgi:hypothetical protein
LRWLYLPTIAGSFVSATVASAFGHSDNWGQLAFGVGMVLLARLAFKPFMVVPAFLVARITLIAALGFDAALQHYKKGLVSSLTFPAVTAHKNFSFMA